jgi:hypothetical protein
MYKAITVAEEPSLDGFPLIVLNRVRLSCVRFIILSQQHRAAEPADRRHIATKAIQNGFFIDTAILFNLQGKSV